MGESNEHEPGEAEVEQGTTQVAELQDARQRQLRLEHTQLAELHAQSSSALKGMADQREALRLEAEAHRRLHGAIAAATERHFRARPAAERAETFGALVAELPRWVQGQVELGRALLERGDLPGAEAALKRALELDPGHPAAHQLYGRVLLRQERPKAAELHFQHALSLGR